MLLQGKAFHYQATIYIPRIAQVSVQYAVYMSTNAMHLQKMLYELIALSEIAIQNDIQRREEE